ncbi:MAG: hypothetical protein NTU44_04585 [Bacteroidetes bacterium]|nr:hypothetical protein [Bacteroidota bacterium]
MKNVSLQEFLAMHIENPGSKSDHLQSAQELSKQVSQFVPAEVTIQVSEEAGKFYFEQANVRIIHPELELIISYSTYNKKYSIWCRSIDKLKNITHYTRSSMREKLTEPNNIGVLTAKKIQAWIQYYESYFALLKAADTENGDKKDAFLRSLEGQPVEWFNKGTHGRIIKNGLEFSFTISETYVSTKIEVHYSCNKDLSTFLALADNKLVQSKDAVCPIR